MKYVIIRRVLGDGMHQDLPIIFPGALVHAQVADALVEEFGAEHTVIAAGELSSLDINATCYGESQTLQLKSRGQTDSTCIQMHDYLAGITED